MEESYIFVRKAFRPSDPYNPNYVEPNDFYEMMKNEHGLLLDTFAFYSKCKTMKKIDPKLYCFVVIDKGKALKFAMLHSEYIVTPEENE